MLGTDNMQKSILLTMMNMIIIGSILRKLWIISLIEYDIQMFSEEADIVPTYFDM